VTSVHLEGVHVVRGDRVVLDAVDLIVESGERLAVLGPSGSGKTTLLRAIAGLEPLSAGRVRLGGRDVTSLPPGARGIGMVTQEATLQPHLDVRGNLAFPLRVRHVPREEERARVDAEARAFSLRDVLWRRPRTLSAGQRHEVALARSLVRRVSVLLMDEPFGRLDPPRRLSLQHELLQVQEGYGVTMVLATNDQRVALGTGHAVAVLDGGRLVQVAPPLEMFRSPATTFVATFVGEPPMDLFLGEVTAEGGRLVLRAGPIEGRSRAPMLRAAIGRPVLAGVRPTSWQPASDAPAWSGIRIRGRVRRREFLGARVGVAIDVDAAEVHAVLPSPGPMVGARMVLQAPAREVHVFDASTGVALLHGL
jgi:multiple sugar transport system ATP-binding protein